MEKLSSSNADSAIGLAVASLWLGRLRHVRQGRFYLWEWLCYVWKFLLLHEQLLARMAAARSTMPGMADECAREIRQSQFCVLILHRKKPGLFNPDFRRKNFNENRPPAR